MLCLTASIFYLFFFSTNEIAAETNSSHNTSNRHNTTSIANYWWIESSGQIYSSKTDFYFEPENNEDEIRINYYFIKPNLKLGYRLFPKLSKLPWNIILDIYFDNNLKWDVSGKELNRLDWNNNFIYGPGTRLRKSFKSYLEDATFIKDINLDLFVEYLKIDYLSKVRTSTVHRPKDDLKYGVSFWSSFEGEPEKFDDNFLNRLWAEIGADYSHRKSNLFIKDFRNFNIVSSSATIGLRTVYDKLSDNSSIIFYDVYFKTLLEWDTGNNSWNRYDWNNNIKYGPGLILIKYIYVTRAKTSKLVKEAKFDMFFEYLNIDYFKKVEYIPSYKPDNDILFGIRFFMLFGGKEIE